MRNFNPLFMELRATNGTISLNESQIHSSSCSPLTIKLGALQSMEGYLDPPIKVWNRFARVTTFEQVRLFGII